LFGRLKNNWKKWMMNHVNGIASSLQMHICNDAGPDPPL